MRENKADKIHAELEKKKLAAIVANPLRKAEQGVPNNLFGKLFENCINYSVGLLERAQITQPSGKIDCIKYGIVDGKKMQFRIEIKQGASPLATLDRDGKIICSEIRKSNFVCYHPRFIPVENVDCVETAINECLFFTVSDFFDILNEFNAIRLKRSGTQQQRYKQGLSSYHDKETLQSFYNPKSMGKFNRFVERLYFDGMCYQDFVQTYKITNRFFDV